MLASLNGPETAELRKRGRGGRDPRGFGGGVYGIARTNHEMLEFAIRLIATGTIEQSNRTHASVVLKTAM